MFILDIIKADKYNAEADRVNIKALNKMGDAEREQREQEQKTMQALQKLANRKRGIISTSINDFISVYEQIMKINFNESDEIKSLGTSAISPAVIGEMKTMVSVAGYSLDSNQVVSTFLMGTLTGGLLGGVSHIIAKEAELNAAAAKARRRFADVAASQSETITVALDAIYQRAERMAKLLAQLNLLFRKSIETTSAIIDKNGSNRSNYSIKEKEYIRSCLNFADAIKKVLDAPLLDQEGNLTKKSIEVIQTGQEYLQKMNTMVNI